MSDEGLFGAINLGYDEMMMTVEMMMIMMMMMPMMTRLDGCGQSGGSAN